VDGVHNNRKDYKLPTNQTKLQIKQLSAKKKVNALILDSLPGITIQ
jgi:hypothetical protein